MAIAAMHVKRNQKKCESGGPAHLVSQAVDIIGILLKWHDWEAEPEFKISFWLLSVLLKLPRLHDQILNSIVNEFELAGWRVQKSTTELKIAFKS